MLIICVDPQMKMSFSERFTIVFKVTLTLMPAKMKLIGVLITLTQFQIKFKFFAHCINLFSGFVDTETR